MNNLRFYIDIDKAEEKMIAWDTSVIPLLPTIKNTDLLGDAGIDLFAAHSFVIPPHSIYIADSFVGFVMDVGMAGFLWPRGGDTFLVGSGVIDTGYTGTIKVKIINPYAEPMKFSCGSSIGQLVLFKKAFIQPPTLVRIEKKDVNMDTGRGEDGRINTQFALQ